MNLQRAPWKSQPMKDFGGKIAVVTGGGTGMGRALVRQLVAEGCDVATCDIIAENLAETVELASAEAGQGAAGRERPVRPAVPRTSGRLPGPRPRCVRDRLHQPALQQRGHRRRRQLHRGQPGRMGTHVQHLLVRRLLHGPGISRHARRQRWPWRRSHGQHQQRQRLPSLARRQHPAYRVQRGEIRRQGIL